MEFEEIKKLADLVREKELQEIDYEHGDIRLKVINRSAPVVPQTVVTAAPAAAAPVIIREDKLPASDASLEDNEHYHIIKSPIVGTFYSAPSPESPNFVEKNDPVHPESVVCIIEAMKVMNEIQADVSGVVAEVLIQNGQAVEYGQPLFKIKKL